MSADDHRIELGLRNVPANEASRLAAELREFILDEDPRLAVELARTDQQAQDMGATLVVIIASPAVVALARGVAKWIAKRSTASVVMQDGRRKIEIKNIGGSDIRSVVEEVLRNFRDGGDH